MRTVISLFDKDVYLNMKVALWILWTFSLPKFFISSYAHEFHVNFTWTFKKNSHEALFTLISHEAQLVVKGFLNHPCPLTPNILTWFCLFSFSVAQFSIILSQLLSEFCLYFFPLFCHYWNQENKVTTGTYDIQTKSISTQTTDSDVPTMFQSNFLLSQLCLQMINGFIWLLQVSL